MNGHLPMGAYRPGGSALHGLDARVKVACLLAVSVALLAAQNVVALAALVVAVAACVSLAGIGAKELLRGIRPTLFLLAFGIVANAFAPAASADFAVGALGVSLAGLVRGILVAVRMVALIALSLVLCATTSPAAIADALSSLLSPLGRLGVPVDDVSMTLSLVLRFVPMASEELGRIRDAQLARGAGFSQDGLVAKVGRWCDALVPLVVGLFRRSGELAGAMRERGWGAGPRTRLSRKLATTDIMVLVMCLAACAAAVLV